MIAPCHENTLPPEIETRPDAQSSGHRFRPVIPLSGSLKPLLTELFYRVERSLLQYASQTALWTATVPDAALISLQSAARRQLLSLEPLGRLFEQRGWPPHGRSFPAQYAAFNDVAPSFLLPKVVADVENTMRLIADARRSAIARQDSESLIALNRVQHEHRLLLAESRTDQQFLNSSDTRTLSPARESKPQPHPLIRNGRQPRQSMTGHTSV